MLVRSALMTALLAALLSGSPAFAEDWRWSPAEERLVAATQAKIGKIGDFLVVETPHWNVRTDIDPRFTAELAVFLEAFYGVFTDIAGGDPELPFKLSATVFASESDYRRVFDDGSRGMASFNWDDDGNWTQLTLHSYADRPEERDFRRFWHPILLHEGTHLLLHASLGTRVDVPDWFDEGLAEFFECWSLRQSKAENAKYRYLRYDQRELVRSHLLPGGTLPDLLWLLDIQDWNPDNMGPRAEKHYAFAESFMDFLILGNPGSALFAKARRRLKDGEGAQRVFTDEEIHRIQPAWHAYIRRRFGL